MKPRPIWLSLLLIVTTMVAGVAIRMAPLGLPQFVTKYGGSMLWALMIYWLVTSALPALRVAKSGLLAGLIAASVELFKLYRSPAVDAFRATLAGTLLLGRYFSWKDILAYWLAIAAGAWIDLHLRRARA